MFGFNYKYKINPEKEIITLRPTKGLMAAILLPYVLFWGVIGAVALRDKIESEKTETESPEEE